MKEDAGAGELVLMVAASRWLGAGLLRRKANRALRLPPFGAGRCCDSIPWLVEPIRYVCAGGVPGHTELLLCLWLLPSREH